MRHTLLLARAGSFPSRPPPADLIGHPNSILGQSPARIAWRPAATRRGGGGEGAERWKANQSTLREDNDVCVL